MTNVKGMTFTNPIAIRKNAKQSATKHNMCASPWETTVTRGTLWSFDCRIFETTVGMTKKTKQTKQRARYRAVRKRVRVMESNFMCKPVIMARTNRKAVPAIKQFRRYDGVALAVASFRYPNLPPCVMERPPCWDKSKVL